MAILKVAQMGHPVLRRVADPVDPELIPTREFQQICADLLETMEEYEGAGLAAPQVHLSFRVVALTLRDGAPPHIWVNPELTPLTDTTAAMFEGCLSVKGVRGRVSRPVLLHVRHLDPSGERRALILQGFPAVVAQHECDHLDGILYVDRVDPRSLAFLPEFRRYGPMHHYDPMFRGEADEPGEGLLDDDVAHWQDLALAVDPDLAPREALASVARELAAQDPGADDPAPHDRASDDAPAPEA